MGRFPVSHAGMKHKSGFLIHWNLWTSNMKRKVVGFCLANLPVGSLVMELELELHQFLQCLIFLYYKTSISMN